MLARILHIQNKKDIEEIFSSLLVHSYGIRIMQDKTMQYLIYLGPLVYSACLILKQEMLSCGGDVAVPKNILIGKSKKAYCVLIGNHSQYKRLLEKLKIQPFGLSEVTQLLDKIIHQENADNYCIKCAKRQIDIIKNKPLIMGIINITPDSFSGDGLANQNIETIIENCHRKISEGADILDIGGESTRPQAKPVDVKEELRRIIPVVRRISQEIKIPLSVDTYKPQVAKEALEAGANIINDVTGLCDPKMRKIIKQYRAGCIIMHMKGNPRTMQRNPTYKNVVNDIMSFFTKRIKIAMADGIDIDSLMIDPGIGFGKTLEHNLTILKYLADFKTLGLPIVIGTSRKSFIGKIISQPPEGRLYGTIASCVWAANQGANILRVHDVKAIQDALKLTFAIKTAHYL
ncbi:MAG: dihydropteroate synthase [Candidatus Omnitrophica bacterium]|nr:dihydropteroate synthase [Candidatus Omnitrophota bacterium]